MSTLTAQSQSNDYIEDSMQSSEDTKQYLTFYIGHQSFGIPVMQIQDVLSELPVTKIPLAPKEIIGSLNLRGRIVTAINMRHLLAMDDDENIKKPMSIVVEDGEDLYSFIVDRVGDVQTLSHNDMEKNPATLDKTLSDVSSGIYRMDETLLVILDVSQLIATLILDDEKKT